MMGMFQRAMFVMAAACVLTPWLASAQKQEQTQQADAAEPVETVPVTEHWDTKSKITGRTYRIFVSKPANTATSAALPIFYVVDGNLFFPTASQVAWMNVSGGSRPALVVGIGYPTDEVPTIEALRFGDLVPHFVELDAQEKEKIASLLPRGTPPGTGAEAFFRFMKEELQPQLTAKYSVNTADTTLWGHSLGGLFVVETLFKHPAAFRNYVASSPSIHWQERRVLKDEAAFTQAMSGGQVKPRVLIVVGENEQRPYPKDEPLPQAMAGVSREELDQATASLRMVDNARELAERLRKLKGATVQYRLFEGEGHLSAVPASLSRAVTFGLGGAGY